jgi:hypothetical protein
MSEGEHESCPCANFERLTGASVNAYIAKFLERKKEANDEFTCRVCKAHWMRTRGKEVSKAALVKK